jgi:hypothetical protein
MIGFCGSLRIILTHYFVWKDQTSVSADRTWLDLGSRTNLELSHEAASLRALNELSSLGEVILQLQFNFESGRILP